MRRRFFALVFTIYIAGCIILAFGLAQLAFHPLRVPINERPKVQAMESPFASFRQIAYVRVGQVFHTGTWLGKIALRPAVELAFVYGRVRWGVDLAAVSPEASVVGSRVPILLIHGLADQNIPWNQSERIRVRNVTDIVLWEVPDAGHCGAVSVAPDQFNQRVLGWFLDHQTRTRDIASPGVQP